jgi:hypothetical protein
MKTLQEQYILIKEGKGNKDHFLKQAKNLFPEYINQYSSYDSTVSVLKSKSILSEGIGGVISHKPSPSWLEIFRENTNNEAVDMTSAPSGPFGDAIGWISRSNEYGKNLLMSNGITKADDAIILFKALKSGKITEENLSKVIMAGGKRFTDTETWIKDMKPLLKKANGSNTVKEGGNVDNVDYVFNFWKDKSREFTKDVKPMMDKMGMTKDEQDEVDLMLFDYEREQDDDVDKVIDDTDIEDILNEVIGVPNRKLYGDYDEFKKPSKQVQKDLADQFDNEDKKNIDNVYGTSFLNGYYAEMKDPKNKTKTVDELKQIVLKNMVKDINYYAKNAMFGTKGVGFKTEKLTIAPKGKYKSSGYGDLPKAKTIKESIHDLDILLRPSSNPDFPPLTRSPEELGKEADNRSENMLLMKYQKQINDRNITDDELRDILSGQGVKGFGGRKNAIEKIISNRNTN